jgi:hypothetical protein
MKFLIISLLTLSSFAIHAEVDQELKQLQIEQINTQQNITIGATAAASSIFLLNQKRLIAKGKRIKPELDAAKSQQTAAAKSDKNAKKRIKAKTALSLKAANEELKVQSKAAGKNKWATRGNFIGTVATVGLTAQSVLAKIVHWNAGDEEELEEDCCINNEVYGDPSDDVTEDLADLAAPIMHSYKKDK